MPSWPSADQRSTCALASPRLCSGRRLRRALFLCVVATPSLFAQQKPASKPAASSVSQQNSGKDAFAFRSNELTLAGLRPGRDTITKAKKIYGGPWLKSAPDDPGVLLVRGDCTGALLRLEGDRSGLIQQIVLSEKNTVDVEKRSAVPIECADVNGGQAMSTVPVDKRTLKWITGHKISLGSTTRALHAEYGDPGNKSPSTRDGQPLELWYYAFDWAGPDVPQVMEVLCTREQDGKPGRVIEITLAAPSL